MPESGHAGTEGLGSSPRRRLALVIEARFSGGTSSAVAAEIRALAPCANLEVVAIETSMFRGREVNKALGEALDEHGLEIRWNPSVVRADTIVFHNPACLKLETALPTRLSCKTALVTTHENFLRPGGTEAFDVAHCLFLIEKSLVSASRWLAPVSPVNRSSVSEWLERTGSDWRLAPFDWFNVCDMPACPPARVPRDRRGRHSRPGFEKFPPLDVMSRHFPSHAEACVILGADSFLLDPVGVPRHWDLRRFGETDVDRFLEEIDFFVYFTNPLWRESFGRAIAEAIAAGKVVITDPSTAESFGSAVVASQGDDVDGIIREFIASPERYAQFVAEAQAWLVRFGAESFRSRISLGLDCIEDGVDVLV